MSPLTQRLFLAVPTPEETRDALLGWTTGWKARGGAWRWVAPGGIHLTLRFYGETPLDRVQLLVERMGVLAAEVRPIELTVQGWGVFPAPTRPRVLWAGVTGGVEDLAGLALRAEQDARKLGFAAEDRPFHPHLTLARAAQGRDRPRLPGDPDPARPIFGALPARLIVLYASHLGPAGARYEPVAQAILGHGGAPDGA